MFLFSIVTCFFIPVMFNYGCLFMTFMKKIDEYVKDEQKLCDKVCEEFDVDFPPFELRTSDTAYQSCKKVKKQ
ncbi:hypothetical protein V054_02583 [Staphylococcus aureus MSSA-47]|nr:hypothetical protein V054_02583 [Staphylococcus aureus MSSA-47]EZY39787.1 hypothetical protein V055_01761 [Staphylococcus aureus MRSA-118]EZY44948.1 hypothetical protein V057_01154 [Staphylococcus aureus MRSA-136]